jgi:hypothetical protein
MRLILLLCALLLGQAAALVTPPRTRCDEVCSVLAAFVERHARLPAEYANRPIAFAPSLLDNIASWIAR